MRAATSIHFNAQWKRNRAHSPVWMSAFRLTGALENGAFALPSKGRIAVFRPRRGMDLGVLPMDRVHVIQGFRPDHDAFAIQGYDTGTSPEGSYTLSIVFLTRSRRESRQLVAQASVVTEGLVVVDGQKTDGVESLLREIRRYVSIGALVYKAHGRLFSFGGGDFGHWALTDESLADGFLTAPGDFSADGVDPGSEMLASALPARLPSRMADLGAGWGFLSKAILRRESVKELHVVEAECAALGRARRNITDSRARFHWADVNTVSIEPPLDAIVTNPPFHAGRMADPTLGRSFIGAAARLLRRSGSLWLVANRHLPYERELRSRFREAREIAGNGRFKVLAASMPIGAGTVFH